VHLDPPVVCDEIRGSLKGFAPPLQGRGLSSQPAARKRPSAPRQLGFLSPLRLIIIQSVSKRANLSRKSIACQSVPRGKDNQEFWLIVSPHLTVTYTLGNVPSLIRSPTLQLWGENQNSGLIPSAICRVQNVQSCNAVTK